jgi:hypothetical protein
METGKNRVRVRAAKEAPLPRRKESASSAGASKLAACADTAAPPSETRRHSSWTIRVRIRNTVLKCVITPGVGGPRFFSHTQPALGPIRASVYTVGARGVPQRACVLTRARGVSRAQCARRRGGAAGDRQRSTPRDKRLSEQAPPAVPILGHAQNDEQTSSYSESGTNERHTRPHRTPKNVENVAAVEAVQGIYS